MYHLTWRWVYSTSQCTRPTRIFRRGRTHDCRLRVSRLSRVFVDTRLQTSCVAFFVVCAGVADRGRPSLTVVRLVTLNVNKLGSVAASIGCRRRRRRRRSSSSSSSSSVVRGGEGGLRAASASEPRSSPAARGLKANKPPLQLSRSPVPQLSTHHMANQCVLQRFGASG